MQGADLLPDLSQRAELVRRYAHLLHHFGKELGQRPLVLQTAEYFPDRFQKDAPSVEQLVRRLQSHAGLLDVPLAVRLVSLDLADGSTQAAQGCGSGGCGTGGRGTGSCATPGAGEAAVPRLEETARGWILNVFDAELHHPVALTTQLSLALAEVFLAETSSADSPVEEPRGVSRDLACVALGLGVIVLEGSYIYSKSCGGPSVARLTDLSVGDLAIACSLFIGLGKHSARRAVAELGTTQRALLGEANDWAASNARLLAELAQSPGRLATRTPEVRETRSWLLRVFERGPAAPASSQVKAGADADADLLLELERAAPKASPANKASPAKPVPAARAREREELAALVDEALRSS